MPKGEIFHCLLPFSFTLCDKCGRIQRVKSSCFPIPCSTSYICTAVGAYDCLTAHLLLPFQNLCFTSVKFCSVNPFPFACPAVNFPPPAPGYHVVGQIPLSHGARCRCVCKNNTCLRKRILLRNRNAPGRTGCYGQRRDFCGC